MAKRKTKQKSSIIFPFAAIFLVFVLIYLATPKLYTKIKNREYDSSIVQLTSAISTADDIQTLISRYAVENNAYVSLKCDQDASKNQNTPVLSSVSYISKTKEAVLKDGTPVTLEIQYANQELKILNQVMAIVLPVFGLMLIALMGLYKYLNVRIKRDDFEEFRKVTEAMLRMKPKAALSTKDSDKTKNAAARNINELYAQLLLSIQSLRNKMNESTVLEEQMVLAMQELNKSIDAPIEEIKSIVNGMINNEGVYKNHHIYLIETKMKLEALQETISKKLSSGIQAAGSNARHSVSVQEYFKQLASPYELLAMEKRVGIRYKYEKDFQSPINDLMFRKAFNHLMNFTLKQCQSQSNIVILQNQYDMIVAYKDAALTPASIKRVKETDEDIKTLFKIIQNIGLFLDFEATQKKDGMQFVFHF